MALWLKEEDGPCSWLGGVGIRRKRLREGFGWSWEEKESENSSKEKRCFTNNINFSLILSNMFDVAID